MRNYLAARVFPLPMPQLHEFPLATLACRISCRISVNVWVNPITMHLVCVSIRILLHFVVRLQGLTVTLEGKRLQVIFIERLISFHSLQRLSITIAVAGTVC